MGVGGGGGVPHKEQVLIVWVGVGGYLTKNRYLLCGWVWGGTSQRTGTYCVGGEGVLIKEQVLIVWVGVWYLSK